MTGPLHVMQNQYNVGWCYRYGCGVERNYDKAFQWYSLAASQNYSHGMFAVGKAYSKGWGVEQNPHKAFEWYKNVLLPSFAFALTCFSGTLGLLKREVGRHSAI